jgi:hypothetical protein
MSMSMDEYLASVEDKIVRHGWAVQFVGAGEGQPHFHYTVGLTWKGLPEIITFGLPMEVGQTLLNDVGRMMVERQVPMLTGQPQGGILRGFDVYFVSVLDTTEHLTVANRLCGGVFPVRALQMVWPDPQGRFPWDAGFEYGDKIPLLGVR